MTENQEKVDTSQSNEGEKRKSADSKREASWPSVLFFIHLNILGLYGIVVLFTQTKLITIFFCKKRQWSFKVRNSITLIFSAFILTLMGIYGTTVGAHRMWTHRAFKADGFLKFFLMISQTMAGQVRKIAYSLLPREFLSCFQKFYKPYLT